MNEDRSLTEAPDQDTPNPAADSAGEQPPAASPPLTTPVRRIVLLAGGTSGEREVSLNSGRNVAVALREVGHEVLELDIIDTDFIPRLLEYQPDVVFLALHGRDGEDGHVQGLLELLRLPYTGSGVLGSALAMDKLRSKVFYRNAGIQAPECVVISQNMAGLAAAQGFIDRYGLPCVVKPAAEGSSLGVSIVHDAADLPAALDRAFMAGSPVLVERFIAGTEITVPVIGLDELTALPVIEIVPKISEFYDYESKYADGGSDHIIPARLPLTQLAHAQEQAIAAHRALGLSGVSRSDFIVDALGTAWIIETNTIPGMTKTSLLPDSARHIGIAAGDLYTRITEWGIAAHRR